MSNQQQQDKRTASQRIDDMERGLMALFQTVDGITRDLMTIKEAIKLLGNKLDSVVKASNRGEPLTDDTISKIMVENNIEELKEKVQNMVNNGVLAVTDAATLQSFVVGRELNDDGSIANPRYQFIVNALNPDVREKFVGAKAGDILTLQEGKWKFEVLEVYAIQEPTAPTAAPQAEASEQTQSES